VCRNIFPCGFNGFRLRHRLNPWPALSKTGWSASMLLARVLKAAHSKFWDKINRHQRIPGDRTGHPFPKSRPAFQPVGVFEQDGQRQAVCRFPSLSAPLLLRLLMSCRQFKKSYHKRQLFRYLSALSIYRQPFSPRRYAALRKGRGFRPGDCA